MSDGRKRANVVGLIVVVTLVFVNVLLSIGPRSAFSEPKGAPGLQTLGVETPGVETKAAQRRQQAIKADDFGAESIDTAGSKQPAIVPNSKRVQPIPVDLVEERDGNAYLGTTDASKAPQSTGSADTMSGSPSSGSASVDAPKAPLPGANPDALPPGIPRDSAIGAPLTSETTTKLNVTDVDISTLVKTFSALTKRNYIVDNAVKGKVTIHLPTAVTVPEALRIFESVLLLKGFTTVPMGENIWKVIPAKDARQTTIPTVIGSGEISNIGLSTREMPSDALVTQLIRLKNTQASELQQALTQFVSKEGMLTAFTATNSLILIDSAANIQRIAKLINDLDVPALDQDITIIPIVHADAKDVAEKINDILGSSGEGQDASKNALPGIQRPVQLPPMPGGLGQQNQVAQSSIVGEKRALPLRLIPDERTNSLIVVADPSLTEKVRALAEQLDSPIDRSTGRFFVYRLQHADAEELSSILGNLIGGSGSSPSSTDKESSNQGSNSSRRRTGGSSISKRQQDAQNNSPLAQARERLNTALRGAGTATGRTGESAEGKVNLEGEVSIAADPSTNSLVINASKGDYERLKEVIDALDVKRRQVLVEATILEVSLDKEQGTGVELQGTAGTEEAGVIGQTNFGGLTNVLTNPAALTDLTIAAASSGSIVLPGGLTIPSQAVLVSALSRNTNVNVLSSPSILSTDNEEAKIIVGENVPFVTSTATNQTNLNNTFNQVERQDVGITLTITPQISTGDFVILKIFAEISNVIDATRNDSNGPSTTIRTTETTVEVKSGQMIVTGGLISDNVSDATRGVPFFEDIPILGSIFRKESNRQRRTNLLVFITPKIITDQFVARDETKAANKLFEQEIDRRGSEPTREEILHSDRIDRVVQEHPLKEPLPSTVTPPQSRSNSAEEAAARARTLERLSHIVPQAEAAQTVSPRAVVPPQSAPQGDSPATIPNSEEELDLKVAPALPGAKSGKATEGMSTSGISPEDVPVVSPSVPGRAFVVLRQLSSSAKGDLKGAFSYADASKTLGLVVMGEQDRGPGLFFSPGGRYTYEVGGERLTFVCLGVYSSRQEAGAAHQSLAGARRWNTLSAAQALLLGTKGWSKVG